MAEAIIPPLPANDGNEPEAGREEPELQPPADPFGAPVEVDDIWRRAYGAEGGDGEEDEYDYIIPSDAFDPEPPMKANGERVDIDLVRARQVREQLDKAADPLLKALGLSMDSLSRFGYSEQVQDPFAQDLRSKLSTMVRDI